MVSTVVGLALVTVMAQVASAQPGGRRGGGFGMLSMRLATFDQVQSDLKMTDDQKAKVAEIDDQLRSSRDELFQQRPEDFNAAMEKMDKLNRGAADKLSDVLDKGQLKRLAGIDVQVSGPQALNDPIVVDQLSLSDEQKTKLAQARAESRQAMHDSMGQWQDLSREERHEKFSEVMDQQGKKLMAVLTPEQQTEFEQLKGEPIDIDMSQLFPGRGRWGG
jgi:Spy/CpxP family protein refolding chaperone